MSRTKSIRFLSLLLCFILILSVSAGLSGCSRGPKMPEKRVVDHVYRIKEIQLPEDLSWINTLNYYGDRVYLSYQTYDEEKGSENKLWSVDTNGENARYEKLPVFPEDTYIQNTFFNAEGLAFLTYWGEYNEETYEYKEHYVFNRCDLSGKITDSFDLYEACGIDNQQGDEYIWLNQYLYTDRNEVIAIANDRIYLIGSDNKLKKIIPIEMENGYVNNVFVNRDGTCTLLGSSWNEMDYTETYTETYFEMTLDPEQGTLSKPKELTSAIDNAYNLIYPVGESKGGYTCFSSDSDGIYGYNIETEKKELLLSWMNSDLSDTYLNNMIILDDDTFIGSMYDSDTMGEILVRLTRVPEEELVPKYVITLAANYFPYELRSSIVKFNRSNEEYRIEVKTYESDSEIILYKEKMAPAGEFSSGGTMSGLNADILAGNIPDILVADDSMNLDSYINKGLFVDLYTMMEKDETFDKSQYLENIFRAYERNGKLYELVPFFSVVTVAGKSSMLNGRTGWNMDEFLEFLASHPEAKYGFLDLTRDMFIQMILSANFDSFVDRSTGKCRFDGDDFKKVLEYAKGLSTTSIYEDQGEEYDEEFWQFIQNAYRNDDALLYPVQLSSVEDYVYTMGGQFHEEIDLVGFPGMNRPSGTIQSTSCTLAAGAKSALKDGIWQFFKYLLSEGIQSSSNFYGFPVLRSAFEAKLKAAQEVDYSWYFSDEPMPIWEEEPIVFDTAPESDSLGAEEVLSNAESAPLRDLDIIAPGYPYPGVVTEREPVYLTDEQIGKVRQVVTTADCVARENGELMDIIMAEAAVYFDGKKSLDETVKIIQNQASTFIAENR